MSRQRRNGVQKKLHEFPRLAIKIGDTLTFVPVEGEVSYVTLYADRVKPTARVRVLFKLDDVLQVKVENIFYGFHNTGLIWSVNISGDTLNEKDVVYSFLFHDFRANGFHLFTDGDYCFTIPSKMDYHEA